MSGRDQTLSQASVHLLLAYDLGEVRRAAEAVRRFLKQQSCAEADVIDCELALVEACNNAIQYAADGQGPGVEVEISCDAQTVELRITDHTPGFDWPAQIALPEPGCERGRGLFLIHSVMSDVQYARSPRGNLLCLRKIRSRPNSKRLASSGAEACPS
jgi:anti-sigma regulatory factor (Ser/Thr protein kinase)